MGMRRLERARVIALALVVMGGLARDASAQISVDELELFLRPGGGARSAGVIRVTNDSDAVLQAFVELGDWDRDELGQNRFHPPGTLRTSCRDRLEVFPMALRLEPRSTGTLRMSIEEPDADASCWGIVFVQSSETRTAPIASGITYVVRTGIKVYVEPAGATRDGAIEDMRVSDSGSTGGPADAGDTREVEILFHNLGSAHLKVTGALEVRRADNEVAAKLEIPEFPTVPGALRRVKVGLPAGLAPGSYVALALLDYGGAEIAAGQVEFRVR